MWTEILAIFGIVFLLFAVAFLFAFIGEWELAKILLKDCVDGIKYGFANIVPMWYSLFDDDSYRKGDS